jgi:hypothetical protein
LDDDLSRSLDAKASGRKGPKQFPLGYRQIQPSDPILTPDHGHLPVLVGSHVRIGFRCQHRIGFRPIVGRRPPDAGKVEWVTTERRNEP